MARAADAPCDLHFGLIATPEEARRRAEGSIRAMASPDDLGDEPERRGTLAGIGEASGRGR
jgi:hypothetical protein